MLNEDEYSSDTSDEDFIPEGVVESEDDGSEHEIDENEEEDDSLKRKNKKLKKNTKHKKKKNPLLTSVEESVPDPDEEKEEEKEKEVDEVKEATKAKDLWDDFLADVEEPVEKPKPKSKNSWASLLDTKKKKSSSSDTSSSAGNGSRCAPTKAKAATPSRPSTVKITKIFEFAGEEVRVEEEVAADSEEAKASEVAQKNGNPASPSKNTPGKRSLGLSSIIGLLDSKKQKLSTLEKTKLDWKSFKSSQGITEELNTHLKSKEGYLEKQAFLERADLKQFEIEKDMRMSKSKR